MNWLQRVLGADDEDWARVADPLTPVQEDTQVRIAAALTFGFYSREPLLEIGRHCARVAQIAGWLAVEVGVTGSDLRALRRAAELHEIGMIAVPDGLLDNPDPLDALELMRIRNHALIGAEIVRRTEAPLVAWLIENQYTDYATLRAMPGVTNDQILLAGLFRAADVFDAVTVPRPYQRDFPLDRRREVLGQGNGTVFHPEVLGTLFRCALPSN